MQLFEAPAESVGSPAYWGLSAAQAAFFAEDEHCLCVACPGAGKTRTVIAKVARLCHEWGPGSVLTITFTRAAAQELRARLAVALGPELAKAVRANTFHALAYRQLSAKKALRLVSAAEQLGLIARARSRAGSKRSLDRLVELIAAYKRRGSAAPGGESSEEHETTRCSSRTSRRWPTTARWTSTI